MSQSELDDISIQTKRNDSSLCLFLANSDNTTPTNQLQASGNALSNIISFQTLGLETALTASDVSTASSTTVSVYQLDTSTVEDKKSDLFVDKDQLNSNGFLPDVSYYSSSKSLFDPATGTYSTTDSAKALKQVAVIVSYDDSLINSLYSINLGNDVLSSSDAIGFSPDWSFIL